MSARSDDSSNRKTRRKRSKRAQSKESIKKLFNRLRNESENSFASLDNSVILVSPAKRKLDDPISNQDPKRKKREDDSPIVIDDTTLVTNEVPCYVPSTPNRPSPVHCSTPITKGNEPDFIPLRINQEEIDLTKEINRSSFLTIDLTTETVSQHNTVIDLESSADADCTIVSQSNPNLSMSGDSDVTVLNMPASSKKELQMRRFAKGIAKLDSKQKGRLLEMITQNIFNSGPSKANSIAEISKGNVNRATETAEDTYIKEVILGQPASRNSIGSNIYNPERDPKNRTGLRMIVIDGSNVAVEHGKGKVFSVKGLKICIDYFLKRGHVVKAFVPRFRCKFGKSTDPRQLDELERRGLVVYTPSREIQGRMVTCYDDRYIVQCAAEFDGVIVSGDNYRDLLRENPRWRFVIENRLLQFTWVNDMIMFPKDPLGRNGPPLEQFLRHTPVSGSQSR